MNKLIVLCFMLFSFIPASVGATQNDNFIFPVNSKKDIEIKIAGLLKEEQKINLNLKVMDSQSGDLRVSTMFEEDKKSTQNCCIRRHKNMEH